MGLDHGPLLVVRSPLVSMHLPPASDGNVLAVINRLVAVCPEALNWPSRLGHTPLTMALYHHQSMAPARHLLELGAELPDEMGGLRLSYRIFRDFRHSVAGALQQSSVMQLPLALCLVIAAYVL